jgi:histidinol phosphate phosphatase hisN-like protein
MDVIEAHARRLPAVDDRWAVRPHTRQELLDGLRAGKAAGLAAHPIDNVRRNIQLLVEQDPDKLFAMSDMPGRFDFDEILDVVEAAAGEPIDRTARFGPVHIAAEPILAACEALGDRLARAALEGERVVVATGHPNGLDVLYRELARLVAARGGKILHPADRATVPEPGRPDPWRIRYLEDVALVTDDVAAKHTHAGDAMRRILAEERPDLVLADHGLAGAAIDAGIEAVSVADVNDPALIVAKAQGRTEIVVVMDDNVNADDYWPCFQAVASRFPPR